MSLVGLIQSMCAVLAVMALVSLLETALPWVRDPARRRLHRLPNLALVALTLAFNFALQAGAVLLTAWLGAQGFGLLAGVSLPPLAMLLIACFVLDGATYACHRCLHALPPLWSAHRVHHCDPLVDVTTTFRQHPIEGLWRFLFILAPVGLLGIPAEAVASYRVISALVGLAEHMNVNLWKPLDRALMLLTCTPNMHKLHHSRLAIETDSNFGNLFSCYDRVFGSFRAPMPARPVAYGLAGFDDAASQRLGALLRLPLGSGSSSDNLWHRRGAIRGEGDERRHSDGPGASARAGAGDPARLGADGLREAR